jgi:hypothetical protein
MFLAIVFIVLGLFLLLNALGIIVGANVWGLFWAVLFLAIGFKMLMKRGKCPICGMHYWESKMHGKIHDRMHEHCCGHDHEHSENEEDHH